MVAVIHASFSIRPRWVIALPWVHSPAQPGPHDAPHASDAQRLIRTAGPRWAGQWSIARMAITFPRPPRYQPTSLVGAPALVLRDAAQPPNNGTTAAQIPTTATM